MKPLLLPKNISLRTKFIIFIGAIISCSYIFMLYRTAVFDERMIIRQAEQQARMLYKQIVLTRQWAADHNGLFILERQNVAANPYLDLPKITDASGNVYYLRNPAMITRELSQYADRDGLGHFRVTSLNPVNPGNAPDATEEASLKRFQDGIKEEVIVKQEGDGRVVRFIAPLRVKSSCLGCHQQHGYELGDIRGALSITIPIRWADNLIQRNTRALIVIGIVSILLVTIALFLMFETLVVHRTTRLAEAMDRYPDRVDQESSLPSLYKDELDTLHDHFEEFCDRLDRSQNELIKTRTQAHFSEKMASLGILTSGIAHEVNNPLGGMLNCVKRLRENPDDMELHQRYLPLIDKGLSQIEHTMQQLLNFGRTEPLSVETVDLKGSLQQCAELLQYKLNDIELVLDVTVSRHLRLDGEALKQIIINIGLNAIQAMPQGGTLKISCHEDQDYIILVFSDTGIGIDEESLPYIFDPFYTTKEVGEGTGLGLSVTYSLVTRMGGRIDVQSAPGQGTEFTIHLPLLPRQNNRSRPASPKHESNA